MTLREFDKLPIDEKALYLWENRAMTSDYVNGAFTVLLYQVHDFYVEIYYHTSLNEVYLISTFDNPEGLGRYIAHIEINKLLKYNTSFSREAINMIAACCSVPEIVRSLNL